MNEYASDCRDCKNDPRPRSFAATSPACHSSSDSIATASPRLPYQLPYPTSHALVPPLVPLHPDKLTSLASLIPHGVPDIDTIIGTLSFTRKRFQGLLYSNFSPNKMQTQNQTPSPHIMILCHIL